MADFGLAKIVAGDVGLTATGASVGTPAYMSPEQGQGLAVDHHTDVYALGVMLYEMVTGRLPFHAKTPMALILMHIVEPPPDPRQVNPALPQAVADVILRMLDKTPGRRYASAGEMARAFQSATAAVSSFEIMTAPPSVSPVSVLPPQAVTGQGLERRKHLIQLRQILDSRFDQGELRTLCFDLGIDLEDLPGEGQADKARELVAYLERHDRIPELLELGKQNRPDIPWKEIFGPSIVSLGLPLATVYIPTPELTPPPEPTRPPEVEFVGRETEIIYFADRLATSHLAVITGMAGVGKTALAAALAQRVASPGRIFWHAFHEGEGVDALLWKLAGFLAWLGKEDVWRMLQGTRQTGGEPPPIQVLIDYLFQMLRGGGYLLCLDDFQFVDDDPLLAQLVERLRKGVASGELSLIITSRRVPDFVGTSEYKALSGLSATDTDQLLAARGVSLSKDLVAELYTHTEGNAELLTLALDALKRAKDPARLITRLAETEDIERFLMNQVDSGLTEEEREVMSAVALLGYPGTRDAIETVLDGGSVRRTLSDLSQRHLLAVGQGEWGREYSQHAMVRAFCYDLLGRRERREMHHRAGEFYEGEEPDALKAARHYQRGGKLERAAELATAGVWTFINQGQVRPLTRLLERFAAPQLAPVVWARVNLARGEVHSFLSDRERSREHYQAALSVSETLPDTSTVRELRAQVCRGIGDLMRNESPQEALDWLHRGLDELKDASRSLKADLNIKVGTAQIYTGAFAEARASVQRGLDLLPDGPSQSRLGALLNLGIIYSSQGDLRQASEVASRALEISRQLNDHFRMISVLNNLSLYRMLAGDWEGAIETYRQGLDLAKRLGSINFQVPLGLNLGLVRARQGNFESARQHFADSLDLARAHSLRRFEIMGNLRLADLHLWEGEPQAASPLLAEAERLALEMNVKDQLPDIYCGQARMHLAREEAGVARGFAERAAQASRELAMDYEEGIALRVLGQTLLADGQPEPALTVFENSLVILEEQDPYEAARTKMQWGIALSTVGKGERGAALLQEARAAFQGLGARRDETVVEQALRGP